MNTLRKLLNHPHISTNGAEVPAKCQVSDPFLVNSGCPSSGWQAIESFFDLINNLRPSPNQLSIPLTKIPTSVELPGENSLRWLSMTFENDLISVPGYDVETIVATTPQAAVANALTTIGTI